METVEHITVMPKPGVVLEVISGRYKGKRGVVRHSNRTDKETCLIMGGSAKPQLWFKYTEVKKV